MTLNGDINDYSKLSADYFNEVEDTIADNAGQTTEGYPIILEGMVITYVSTWVALSYTSGRIFYNGLMYDVVGDSHGSLNGAEGVHLKVDTVDNVAGTATLAVTQSFTEWEARTSDTVFIASPNGDYYEARGINVDKITSNDLRVGDYDAGGNLDTAELSPGFIKIKEVDTATGEITQLNINKTQVLYDGVFRDLSVSFAGWSITDVWNHLQDSSIHFTEASIDHAAILNKGTNTHAQIDSHIGDSSIHFTEASIDHAAILNKGTNTHAQIDSHIGNTTGNPHDVDWSEIDGDLSEDRIAPGTEGYVLKTVGGTTDWALESQGYQDRGDPAGSDWTNSTMPVSPDGTWKTGANALDFSGLSVPANSLVHLRIVMGGPTTPSALKSLNLKLKENGNSNDLNAGIVYANALDNSISIPGDFVAGDLWIKCDASSRIAWRASSGFTSTGSFGITLAGWI